MDGKVDLLQKHIVSICKKVDFNTRMKIMQMEWKGGTTTAMETTHAEAVDSSLMASGISTAASASMSSCASKKRGMNQVINYKGSQLKSLKAFYEPVRLSEFEQGQMNLALLHAMIACNDCWWCSIQLCQDIPFSRVHENNKTKLQDSKSKACDGPLSCPTLC